MLVEQRLDHHAAFAAIFLFNFIVKPPITPNLNKLLLLLRNFVVRPFFLLLLVDCDWAELLRANGRRETRWVLSSDVINKPSVRPPTCPTRPSPSYQ